ncbi:TonB-dependent receptor [Psychrobium sp. nBUS_13]|uniref:TonB-dependent receptor n=1 Tax=Psychrobium sp. nBUS_13 TaxID=3395319 RepID=UPI003EBA10C6
MKDQKIFTRTRIAASVSAVLSISSIAPAMAAEEAKKKEIERITVSGVLSSIKESTRLKRDGVGVVDAISAEDIGKFPDTNLAESLQRITGVSIDRANGEGSKVTVRGFGPDYNMVTLNGRTMPASGLPSGGAVANSRAFDFANLASDAVKTVAVYKTGRADIATGGIGATVDIVTGKPLYNAGTHVSIGAKALMDTTNRVGSDMTPELSGLFSWTDEEEKFGASLTFNSSKRDSSASGAFVNQWRTTKYDGTIPQAADDIVLTNAPQIGQIYSMPSDLRYYVADRERERTNAQLTFQYRPSEKLTTTLDYTYSKQDLFEARAEQSIWMDTFKSNLGFDNNTVATPVDYNEDRGDQAPRDLGLALQQLNQVTENKSIGFNVMYEANDALTIVFDAHSSTADSKPDAPYGSWLNTGLGANISAGQGVDFSNDFPTMRVDFDDCNAERGLNCNNVLDQNDVGTSILDMRYASQESEINQFRLSGSYEFDEGQIDFGIESRSMESHSQQSLTRHTMGNWGVENPGELPEGFLTPIDFTGEIEDFNTTGAFNQGFTGDAAQIGAWAAGQYGFNFVADGAFATDRVIKEDITAAFAQLALSGELGGRPYNITAGLRFESTDVNSVANIIPPNAVAWESDNDFNVRFGGEDTRTLVIGDSSYDHLLPSFDFDIELTDDIKARASYSKTIARPTYNQLNVSHADVSGPNSPTILAGSQLGTASKGNVALAPLESDNIDISVEWYFDETSYVSVGYYEKRVSNFAGRQPVEENVYGLRDVTAGPRALAARTELEALGLKVTDANLFGMVAAMENGLAFDVNNVQSYGEDYDILPNSSDPLAQFNVAEFVNNREAKIDGFEIAVQHFFGDSGFGLQANYTTVNGDISFDNNGDPSVTQFALVGLSDTANIVGIYEQGDFQARIAYNWRDKFLSTQAQYINEPSYTEAYAQIDFNASYQVTEELSVFFEGINLTGEDTRSHGRTKAQLWNLAEQKARYALGARYTF